MNTNDNQPKTLTTGTWFMMRYGGGLDRYYVAEVAGQWVRFSKPFWLASYGIWETMAELNQPRRDLVILGKGSRKWYWEFLPWRDLICPFYRYKPS